MGKIAFGTVTVECPDSVMPPERAGRMTPEDMNQLDKARKGLGLVTGDCGDVLQKLGTRFMMPPGLTVEALVAAGERAELIDRVVADAELALQRLRQANLLFDAEAHGMLRALNDQVKAQAKNDPELLKAFHSLVVYFGSKRVLKDQTPA